MDLLKSTLLASLALVAGCASSTAKSPVPTLPEEGAAPVAAATQVALRVTDMDGGEHDLSAIAQDGTPVVLVFWQTWCASCRKEAPELIAATRQYEGKLAFFGVVPGPEAAVDDAEVRRVAKAQKSPWPQVRDRDLFLTKHFKVDGTPTIVVVGEGGVVLYHGHQAPASWDDVAG